MNLLPCGRCKQLVNVSVGAAWRARLGSLALGERWALPFESTRLDSVPVQHRCNESTSSTLLADKLDKVIS